MKFLLAVLIVSALGAQERAQRRIIADPESVSDPP
jgi:hypothetical protein